MRQFFECIRNSEEMRGQILGQKKEWADAWFDRSAAASWGVPCCPFKCNNDQQKTA